MNEINLPKSVTSRSQINVYVSEKNQELLKELKQTDPEASWSSLLFKAVEFYLEHKREAK